MNQHPDTSANDDLPVTDEELLVGDLTAAMLQEQLTADDQMPPALAARIANDGEALVRANAVPSVVPLTAARPLTDTWRPSWLMWGGWLAAAAMLVLFVQGNGSARATEPAGVVAAIDPREALRDSLLAAPGVQRQVWTPTTDSSATGASGEVLWDPVSQRGVMRFVGLTANDRERWQYQLWIFDAERDERYPVDGGVFDIPSDRDEVLVPIRARLGVAKAVLFAVTVEQPGGVVVSNRERIAVTAQL